MPAVPMVPRKTAASAQHPGSVRIIGGQWRSRKLPVVQGDASLADLRPTPDRVRETLFNWLGQDLRGWVCVDACAGTGALGFEAASRGAARVVMAEQHRALLQQLRRNQTLLAAKTVEVVAGDGVALLHSLAQRQPGSVDVVFFDPPFANSEMYLPALNAASTLLAPQGWFYLESGREWPAQACAALGWQRVRHLKAGADHAHLLQRQNNEETAP